MLYADDMQLYISYESDKLNDAIACLNADLATVSNWCSDHCLSLNLSKCKPTIFGTSILLAKINYNDTYKVKINNNCLSFETSIVNLGIRMSSNLFWSDQVDYIHKKVYQSLSV